MGSGIAEICARADLDVLVTEVDDAALEAGRERIARSLSRGVQAGKLSEAQRAAAFTHLTFTTDLGDFGDRELVVEAVAEHEPTKIEVFAILDKVVVGCDAIFASNTSSIPIMKLAMATSRPDQFIGMHFFNPVPVLKLVEVIPSLLTSEDTVWRAEAFICTKLDKVVVRSQDRAGFIVNALLIPYLLSAIRMAEFGFASAEDIDNAMVLGCVHPLGPLALADLIGLDTTKAVAESMYDEFKEHLYAPPPLLLRMVNAGLLGKKSGRGFYDYSNGHRKGGVR
jgi:3-hydroxybutyryl-CoA dehydrogenase